MGGERLVGKYIRVKNEMKLTVLRLSVDSLYATMSENLKTKCLYEKEFKKIPYFIRVLLDFVNE